MVKNDVFSGFVMQSLSNFMNFTSRNFMLRGESFRTGLILIIEEIIDLYQITNGYYQTKLNPLFRMEDDAIEYCSLMQRNFEVSK